MLPVPLDNQRPVLVRRKRISVSMKHICSSVVIISSFGIVLVMVMIQQQHQQQQRYHRILRFIIQPQQHRHRRNICPFIVHTTHANHHHHQSYIVQAFTIPTCVHNNNCFISKQHHQRMHHVYCNTDQHALLSKQISNRYNSHRFIEKHLCHPCLQQKYFCQQQKTTLLLYQSNTNDNSSYHNYTTTTSTVTFSDSELQSKQCDEANDEDNRTVQQIENLTKTWRTNASINPLVQFPVWVCGTNGKYIQSLLQSNVIQPYLATQYELIQHLHVRFKVVRTIDCRKIQPDDKQKELKVLLLHPNTPKIHDLPKEVQSVLHNAGCVDGNDLFTIQFHYQQFTASYILNQLLPKSIHPVPTAFETVGHVAHLNLKNHHYPYRTLIGEVIYETLPNIETVIQKIGNVTGPYRTFDYEVLAGKQNHTNVQLSESGVKLHFDLQYVYWCSRLSEERQRLLQVEILPSSGLSKSERNRTIVVADAFCGIGAICIQAALANPNIVIWANDWNQYATKTLYENAIRNNIDIPNQLPRLTTGDAYTFLMDIGMTPSSSSSLSSSTTTSIVEAATDQEGTMNSSGTVDQFSLDTLTLVQRSPPRRRKYHRFSNKKKNRNVIETAKQENPSKIRLPDHVLMNFPLEAPNFLGALRWWPPSSCCVEPTTATNTDDTCDNEDRVNPRIHVYTFARSDNEEDDDDHDDDLVLPIVEVCNNQGSHTSVEEVAVNIVADNLLPQFPISNADLNQQQQRQQNISQRSRRQELNEDFNCNIRTHIVRDVAPGKVVVCVSFTVTAKLLLHMRGEYL